MSYFILSAIFAFGLIIGSFLNVVVLRWNTGMPVARGRSACFSCGRTLSWHELVPVLSFVLSRGRCRNCGSRISWQYPLVETAGGAAAAVAYLVAPDPVSFILVASILWTYVAVFAYDLRHKIIPDAFSYLAAALSLGLVALDSYAAGGVDLVRLAAGPALFLFFFAFWISSRGTWMGLGDAKLALSIGWMLGLSAGAAAILLSFWIGAIAALALMALQRLARRRGGIGMKSAIPFGPFMIVGALVVLLFGLDLPTLIGFLAL